mgnify:CR=1 FL=1
MNKRLLHILALAAIILTVDGCGTVGSFIIRHGLERDYSAADVFSSKEMMEGRVPGLSSWIDRMYLTGQMHDTTIVRDGCSLHANYASAQTPSGKTAIIVHGYSANTMNMMHIARMFRDSLGYNILLPDLRHHGLSGGDAVQMGWLDRLDVLDWSATAHQIFADTLQVFHGISMGAATIMNASGEDTPDYVRGFISDCGFSSLWDVVDTLATERKLPAAYLLKDMETKIDRRFGWSIRADEPARQIAKCSKPMLFIHGDADQIVPVSMARTNYDAKVQGYREIWIAEGSRHAFSYPDYPAEYTAVVRRFLKEHVE